MKKVLLLSVFLCNFLIKELKANHEYSILNLSINNHSEFTVVLDGIAYNSPCHKFRVEDLVPGNHILKVITYNRGGYCNSMPKVIFHGYINISAATEIFAMIDQFHRFKVCRSLKIYRGIQQGCSYMDEFSEEFNNPYSYFNNLKMSIESKAFDSSKKKIAMRAIESNQLTSHQIKEILLLFDFESSRVDVAKYAYFHVLDPQNYFLVSDAFDFESSLDELNDFIVMRD